ERRPVHERLDETDLLPVPLRERPHRPVELELEPSGERVAVTDVAHPPQRGEVAQVLARGEALVEPEVAGEVTEAPSRRGPRASHVRSEELDSPRARTDQVEQQPDRRRLAGAVGPEVAE